MSKPGGASAPYPSERGQWLRFYEQLATAVASGKQDDAPVSPSSVVVVLGVMEAARRSFDTKARVYL